MLPFVTSTQSSCTVLVQPSSKLVVEKANFPLGYWCILSAGSLSTSSVVVCGSPGNLWVNIQDLPAKPPTRGKGIARIISSISYGFLAVNQYQVSFFKFRKEMQCKLIRYFFQWLILAADKGLIIITTIRLAPGLYHICFWINGNGVSA